MGGYTACQRIGIMLLDESLSINISRRWTCLILLSARVMRSYKDISEWMAIALVCLAEPVPVEVS